MMRTAVISIKPKYAEKIKHGEKRFEYRKRDCLAERLIVYETAPVGKVTMEISHTGNFYGRKETIWDSTHNFGGISKGEFDAYFAGCDTAYAYQLAQPIIYRKPKPLSDFGIKHAPQSFVYLRGE